MREGVGFQIVGGRAGGFGPWKSAPRGAQRGSMLLRSAIAGVLSEALLPRTFFFMFLAILSDDSRKPRSKQPVAYIQEGGYRPLCLQ